MTIKLVYYQLGNGMNMDEVMKTMSQRNAKKIYTFFIRTLKYIIIILYIYYNILFIFIFTV